MSHITAVLKSALLPAATFVAGAALALSLSTHAKPPAPAPLKHTVVNLSDAPALMSPSGAATMRALARGEQAFLGILTMNGGGKVPLHADATEEFIYVIDGSGALTVDGTTQAIKPGTAIFMPAGAKVSYQNGPTPLVALQVFAGPKPADKYRLWKSARASQP